jgi:hypothetical protein
MKRQPLPNEEHGCFDLPSWQDGYQRGYVEGRADGEALGEQATRETLLRQLGTWGHDVRLGLVHDVATRLETVHAVMRLVEQPRGGAHAKQP